MRTFSGYGPQVFGCLTGGFRKPVIERIVETHALPTRQIRPAAVIGAGIAGLTGSGPRDLCGACVIATAKKPSEPWRPMAEATGAILDRVDACEMRYAV